MLRGTLVRVNDKVKPVHLKGTTGIALRRTKDGYIQILSEYKGWLTDLAYKEDTLDIIEEPTEL